MKNSKQLIVDSKPETVNSEPLTVNHKLETVKIGLEIHVQLNTKSKLFCGCTTKEGNPNSHTCPTCLGMPGAKPRLNKKAIDFMIKICTALKCTILTPSYFSRKTYFYPDLSKNYQITQYETPLGRNGKLHVDGTTVRIKRVHLEEDPAALEHTATGTLIDYNRSGIPLAEIVTEPDIQSPEHARAFLKKIVNTLSYLNVTTPEMTIKADANISIKKHKFMRVEIKNITGFKEIERALMYEAQRQEQENPIQETRRWDGTKTISMRTKETEEDYGYIYDPDLPQIIITKEHLESVQKEIPKLSDERVKEYTEKGVAQDDAEIITQDLYVADLYELVAQKSNPVTASKWFRKEVLKRLNADEKTPADISINALIDILKLLHEKKITEYTGRELMTHLYDKTFKPKEHVQQSGTTMITDTTTLEHLCKEAIQKSSGAVEDYKKGQEKALNAIVGLVMKETKGTAKPDEVKRIIEELLKK